MAKIRRNDPCYCGSGKKAKHCHGAGRTIPITPELGDILEDQRKRFIDRFGREPGPDDPAFFDLPPAEHLEAEMVATMRQANLRPEIIYAFEKTGRLVSEANVHLLSQEDIDEWNQAVDEYRELHGE